MKNNHFWDQLGVVASKPLFVIAGTKVTLWSIGIFVVILVLARLLSAGMQRGMRRALAKKFAKREGALAALLRLSHYLVLLAGFTIALQTIGINISTLFTAGAIFAVAIGFAMQNIVQNFVSGVILLVERSIKPGDILEVNGTVVKVVDMGIRTTLVRTWKEEELILPNSTLSQGAVKNYTLHDSFYRLGVTVGVSYRSDMQKVMNVLEDVARSMEWALVDPPPRVLLLDFGNSSVDFGVYVHVDNPWRQRVLMSELRKAVWFALQKAGITIAYPQLDLHLDPEVTLALQGKNNAHA